ncbi:host attachment protein (plasmid) [Rhizobium jaguaris]|uniref:Host attachment protein n=2 Tax=Rhizobium jaguaris TaxID=1312183 RepID=A0A387FYY6_9HYPH|nr:host attachment protein [Rhizobium jaguaris]
MQKVRIPRESWVLVCDGVKALFLRNDGDAELLNLIPVEVYGDETASQASASDRQGRVYQSQGRSRSVHDLDLKQRAEEAFVGDVARRLDELVRDHEIRHLTVIAAPKALGALREQASSAVHAAIRGEIAKDFTMLPIPEIEERLAG